MMTNDDVPRNQPPYPPQGRKPIQPNSRYSPSPSYNYNYNSNSSYPSQQHLRRKMDNRFKRDNGNSSGSSDRLMRQNDLIIRLLKEIRDRLPPPPVTAAVSGVNAEAARQNGPAEEMERTEAPGLEPQAAVPEPGNQAAEADAPGEALQAEPQVIPEPSGDGD
jgi:hypothetical protein